MRLLGPDVGSKIAGVVINDELGLITQELETISTDETRHSFDMKTIKKIVREYDVTGFVLGLPRNMDGSDGASVNQSKNYDKKLEEEFSLPVAYSGERLTTIEIDRILIEEAEIHNRKKGKEVTDQVAAILILQNYLDLGRRDTDDGNN